MRNALRVKRLLAAAGIAGKRQGQTCAVCGDLPQAPPTFSVCEARKHGRAALPEPIEHMD